MTHSLGEKQKKVCLVTISLSEGGAERSTSLLSKMLDNEDFNVHIVSIKNKIDYDYSGTLFTLGSIKKSMGFLSTFNRLLKFRNYLKRNSFDFIIDNRTRQSSLKEIIYTRFIYKGCRVIYVVRSASLSMYFPHKRSTVLMQASKAYRYVGVSKAITKMISEKYGISNVNCIYNPIPLKEILKSSLDKIEIFYKNYIIAMGRLDEPVKNYSLLLKAYRQSSLPEKKIKLLILGKGPDEYVINEKIKYLELENDVTIVPFTSNPFPWLKNAYFTVLTSKFEGFPRVLIESLAVGTPVVSVDCVSGPSEIIQNKINGLLVPNNNPSVLAKAMDSFIFDRELYNTCKKNAEESVSYLDIENISDQWKQLLHDELR